MNGLINSKQNLFSKVKSFVFKHYIAVSFAIYFVIVSAFFFNFPMLFSQDSHTYVGNAIVFNGVLPFTDYESYRGPFVSLVMAACFKLFGQSVFAVKIAYYLFFAVFATAVFFIVEALGFLKGKMILAALPVATLVAVTCPTITAYSHYCLTEFPAIALITAYLCCFLRLSKQKVYKTIILTVLFSVLIYSLKQASFMVPIIIFISYEVVQFIKKAGIKPIIRSAVCLVICMVFVLSYIKIWGSILPTKSLEGDSVQSFAGSFITDGLRYFVPQQQTDLTQPTTIHIMDNYFEKVTDTFEYQFTGGVFNSLGYLCKALSIAPIRVLKGYEDNFSVICGVHTVISLTIHRAHERVTTTMRFFNGQENEAFLSSFCTLNSENYLEKTEMENVLLPQNANLDKFYSSLATKIGLTNVYNRLSLFQYSFISYFSPIIFLLSLVCIIFLKKKNKPTNFLETNAMLSLATAVFVCFLAFTAQNIDRYGIVILPLCSLFIINTFVFVAKIIVDSIKSYKTKKLLKASETVTQA